MADTASQIRAVVSGHVQKLGTTDEMSSNLNEVELKQACGRLNSIVDQIRATVEVIIDETNAVLEPIDGGIPEYVGDNKNQSKHHRIDAFKKYMSKLCLICKEIVDVLYVVKQSFVYCSTHDNDPVSLVKFLKSKHRLEELCLGLWILKNKCLDGEFEIAFNGNVTGLKENVDRVRKHVTNFLQTLNETAYDIEKQTDHNQTTDDTRYSDGHKLSDSARSENRNNVDTNPAQRHVVASAKERTKEIETQESSQRNTILDCDFDPCRSTDKSDLKKDPQNNGKKTSESETKEETIQIDDLELRFRENDSQINSKLDNTKTTMDVDKSTGKNLREIRSDFQPDIPVRSGIFLDAPRPLSATRPLVQDVILSKNRVLTKESNPPGYHSQAIQVQHKLKLQMTKQMFVKLPNDVHPCDIYDIACMPDGKVIVSDRNNSCIKLFNEDNDQVKYLHTKYPPYSVVSVSNTLFMFVCGHAKNRLNLASITTGLEVRQEFTTNHACVALATNNSFVYVLCNNDFRTEIHILNTEGVVNMKIDIGNHVKYPQYIEVDPITERIHVTDNEGVYSVDRSGRQVTHIRDTAISGYHGITTDNRR